MSRIALVVALLGSCTGRRPAVENAEPQVQALANTPDVRSLGDGCYLAGKDRLYSCSIDSLPAGELICAAESSGTIEEFAVSKWRHGAWDEPAYDSNLDSFVELLNTHRCEQRWIATAEARVFGVSLHDILVRPSKILVPLAELGLVNVATTIPLTGYDATVACRSPTNALQPARNIVCVEPSGAVTVDWPQYATLMRAGVKFEDPHHCCFDSAIESVPAIHAIFAPARSTMRPETRRCAAVEIAATSVICNG